MKTQTLSRATLIAAILAFFPMTALQAGWKNNEDADAIVGRAKLPSAADFHQPNGIAVGAGGKVFVVDSGYNRVLRFASAAALANGQAAEAVFGQADFSGADPGTSQTRLSYPQRAAVDAAGNLWVSEFGNSRILRWADAENVPSGSAAVQVLGQADFTSRGQRAGQAGMGWPAGIAIDPLGRLWVADYWNNRVLRFDNPTAKGNGGAADGVIGQVDFSGRNSGLSASSLDGPSDVAVDAQNRLWVADTFNRRVLRFDTPDAANHPDADGVLGQPGFSDKSSGGGPAQMGYAMALQISPDGSLSALDRDNRRILRWDQAAAKPNGAAADGVLGRVGLGSSAEDAAMPGRVHQDATALALDAAGRLWLVDRGVERVLRWDSYAQKPDGAPADGVIGDQNPGVLGLAVDVAKKPYSPRSGIEDPATGKFFVADASRVLRYSGRSAAEAGAAPEAFLGATAPDDVYGATSNIEIRQAWGLALDATGTLWVSDAWSNRIVAFANAAAAPTGAAMSRVIGQADFNASNSGLARDRLAEPRGLALDATGSLYVADYGNHRVLRFDNVAAISSGALADAVIGQADFVTASTGSGNQLLKNPSGVCVDAQGRLWVADSGRNRVVRYDAPLGVAPSDPPSGTLGGIASATPAGMYQPTALAVTGGGRLWVMDNGFNRVLRFDRAADKADGSNADGVLGAPNLDSGSDSSRTLHTFARPECVFLDTAENLWVSDYQNARVLRFTPDIAAVITASGANKDGNFQLTFQALEAGTFSVSSSTDLRTWSPEAIYQLAPGASQDFVDGKGGPQRFFRIEER